MLCNDEFHIVFQSPSGPNHLNQYLSVAEYLEEDEYDLKLIMQKSIWIVIVMFLNKTLLHILLSWFLISPGVPNTMAWVLMPNRALKAESTHSVAQHFDQKGATAH